MGLKLISVYVEALSNRNTSSLTHKHRHPQRPTHMSFPLQVNQIYRVDWELNSTSWEEFLTPGTQKNTAHSHEERNESPENEISSTSSSITIVGVGPLFHVSFVFFLGDSLTCDENKHKNREYRHNVNIFLMFAVKHQLLIPSYHFCSRGGFACVPTQDWVLDCTRPIPSVVIWNLRERC